MKLVSQVNRDEPRKTSRSRRSSKLHWLRLPGRAGQALLFKIIAFAVTAAIAIWAISIYAHTLRAVTQSLDH